MAPASHPWASRLGPAAGFSPHSPPSLDSEYGPFVSLYGTSHAPLVDADSCIYITNVDAITKINDEGVCLWKAQLSKERGLLAGQPALLDDAVLAYTTKGEALALDAGSGRERWRRVFCKGGCVQDISSVAAGSGAMIVSGRDSENDAGLSFHTDVYCLDGGTGKEKWKVKVRLGVMCFNPSVVDGAVLFQSINGEVACHGLADGERRWMSKPSGQVSTGGAVLSRATGLVYSTANKRGKKDWNKPFGGNGCVRAFDFKSGELRWSADLDMEANALPAVAPVGPEGRLIVIVPAGANPGTHANPTGDFFPAKVLALDAKDGAQLWECGPFNSIGRGIGGTSDAPGSRDLAGVAWANPVACANGSIFIGWHQLKMLEIDGATGEVRAEITSAMGVQAGVAVGPDMLVIQSVKFLYIFRNRFWKGGEIIRESEVPFSETGYEHFWPQKVLHTQYSQLPATTDLSKPTWVAGDIESHSARTPGLDFYHTTPVVDSQRNMYLATNLSRILIVRPDGNLRGYIDCGAMASNMCLHEGYLYVCNGAGYCVKVDIETTDIAWNKRYCDRCSKDSWSLTVCERAGLLLMAGVVFEEPDNPLDGCGFLFALNLADGSRAWRRMCIASALNLTPSVLEERGVLISNDSAGNIWCLRLGNGTTVWENQSSFGDDTDGSRTAAQVALGPNGVAYCAWNQRPASRFGTWNRGGGTGSMLRAYDAESGDHRWTLRFPLECHATPVVVPSGGGHVVVVAQGSQVSGSSHGPHPDGKAAEDGDYGGWPQGDAWESCICGVDGETGEELWRFAPPIWRSYGARGSCWGDVFTAACFGGLTADIDGRVYAVHWSGTVYCIEAKTGQVLSEADVGCASKSAVLMVPGTLIVPTGFRVTGYRDERLEREWLERARAGGDARADPRLWDLGRQAVVQADRDLLASVLRTSPEVGAHPRAQPRPFPKPPLAAFGQEAFEARCARLLAEEQKAAVAPASAPPAPAPKAAPAAPPAAAASSGAAKATPVPAPRPLWEVVGGGKAGGITVREEQGLKSAELGRLAIGARAEELALHGERLRYRKVSGDGPETGWVSLTFKGAALVKRV